MKGKTANRKYFASTVFYFCWGRWNPLGNLRGDSENMARTEGHTHICMRGCRKDMKSGRIVISYQCLLACRNEKFSAFNFLLCIFVIGTIILIVLGSRRYFCCCCCYAEGMLASHCHGCVGLKPTNESPEHIRTFGRCILFPSFTDVGDYGVVDR